MTEFIEKFDQRTVAKRRPSPRQQADNKVTTQHSHESENPGDERESF